MRKEGREEGRESIEELDLYDDGFLWKSLWVWTLKISKLRFMDGRKG